MNKNSTIKLLAMAGISAALTACGGGDDGGDSGGGGMPVVGQNGTVEVGSVRMGAGETCGIGNFPQALLAEINKARAQARSCGGQAMPAVAAIPYWNVSLQSAAIKHSSDMATKNFFSHTGSDGSSVYDRAAEVGYQGSVGDNLARGKKYSNAHAVVTDWLSSEGHCKNIMNASWQEIGAACIQNGDAFSKYWTFIGGSGQ